jgi:tripartite-type tricarboxylate transporter receptor subunit TctC
MHRRHLLLAAAAFIAGLAKAQPAASRPLSFIVPYPAGGPADVTARQLEPGLRKALGQPLIVDNVAGVGGALGIQKLLGAPADGQTLLMGTPSDVILGPLALSAVKHRPEQLRLLGLASRAPLLLVSGMQLPARSVGDLLKGAGMPDARDYSYGSIGIGSLYHLVAEDFAARTKLRMRYVPYKGVAPAVQDLIGGQVDLAFLPSAGNLVDLVAQGKLRAYAITYGRRLARLPDVPTLAEAAGLKDFEYEIWGGLFVPQALPVEAAQRLNAAVGAALQEPEYRLSLAEAERFLGQQIARYQRLARQVKLEPQ